MLNEEFNARNPQHPHDQHGPAQTPLVAQNVRRLPAIPVIQLSRATISAITLALLAAVTFGIGYMQLRHWNAGMTINQGQRAIADLIATAALGVLFALGAMVIWGTSVIVSKQSANFERAAGWHARREASEEQTRALIVEQYTGLARLISQQELRNEQHRDEVAQALATFRIQFGQITHRVEQAEATVEQGRKESRELLGCFDDLAQRVDDLEALRPGNVVSLPRKDVRRRPGGDTA